MRPFLLLVALILHCSVSAQNVDPFPDYPLNGNNPPLVGYDTDITKAISNYVWYQELATGQDAEYKYIIFNADGTYQELWSEWRTLAFIVIYPPLRNGTYKFTRLYVPERTFQLDLISSDVTETITLQFDTKSEGRASYVDNSHPQAPFGRSGPFRLAPNNTPDGLPNTSARLTLSPGTSGVVGFVVSSPNSPVLGRSCLVRVVGPGLVAFGVHPVVSNTTAGVSTPEQQGDGPRLFNEIPLWSEDPNLTDSFQRIAAFVGAFSLQVGSNDRARFFRCREGAYSIQCTNSSDKPGDVLCEVYLLP